jgi:hypothetical protein
VDIHQAQFGWSYIRIGVLRLVQQFQALLTILE